MSRNCNVVAGLLALVWIFSITITFGKTVSDAQLQKIIKHQIGLFRGQARKTQFAVLTLFSAGDIMRPDSDVPAIQPFILRGTKCEPVNVRGDEELTDPNRMSYPLAENAVNFIVAGAWDNETDAIHFHSEETIFANKTVEKMYARYKKCFKTEPQYVVLYSWFIPCNKCDVRQGCRNLIVEAFTSKPINAIPNRIVSYTSRKEFTPETTTKSPITSQTTKSPNKSKTTKSPIKSQTTKSPNKSQTTKSPSKSQTTKSPSKSRTTKSPSSEQLCVTLMKQHNIRVIGPIEWKGKRELATQSEHGSQSFQECLMRCYGSMLGACATDKQGAGKLFIDQLMFQIEDSLQDDVVQAQIEAINWIRENVGQNCRSHTNLTQQTRTCISQCRSTGSLFFIGKPFTGLIVDNGSDVFPAKVYHKNPDARGWSRICGGSTEGVLCSKFKVNYMTVGGKNTVTVNGDQCREDSLCLTHGRNYYWCYTGDGGEWDYCCNPHHACQHDEHHKYDWCYTGKKDREKRMYCKVV